MSPEAEGSRRWSVEITSAEAGERIDRVLADRLELSRTRIVALLDEGKVTVGGRVPKKSEPVEEGWTVEVEVPPPTPIEAVAQDLSLEIVYEDEALLVVNKAAGMVVHPAPGHRDGTLVNALLHHVDDLSGIGGKLRPGIVHRLDKDTSGLLVVAKSDHAHQHLSRQLKKRTVRRLYQALAWGHLSDSPVVVDAPIGRDPVRRQRMAVVDDGGRRALTRFVVREQWPAADLVSAQLRTGRTHQIRVHLLHLGHPVVGDEVYGPNWGRGMGGVHRQWAKELARRTPRQFLHAARLSFRHPDDGREMRFRAPLPTDLAAVVDWAHAQEDPGTPGGG